MENNQELMDLAAQYEAEDSEIIEDAEIVEATKESEEPEEEQEAVIVDEEAPEEESPPGFIDNMDDWIAAGKDPDLFKGKKAYKAEYERIQQVKGLQNSFKTMQETLKSTVEAVARREEQMNEQHRRELEAALATAREDGDTDAALEAASKLNEIKSEPRRPAENPVIGEFLSSNAVLESPEIKTEFARIYNGKLRADGVSPDEQLSEAAIRGYLKASMDSVKAIYPDRFVSPKINRPSAPKIKAKSPRPAVNIESALAAFKVDGVSSKNAGAPLGIYKMLKQTAGEEAAKSFAESVLGEKL